MPDRRLRIGEASELMGVHAHVLSYWEREFQELSPERDADGHSLYNEREIDAARRIAFLLYERRCAIAGRKRKLSGARE
jgi:DNA-binding transcriptional MerR regulator